ncbi:MAG TPA: hypothetical protein VJ957_05995 [Longimicrobiales bacterium]|nr:hypothetical protein [Longimicrobiales bacterium]
MSDTTTDATMRRRAFVRVLDTAMPMTGIILVIAAVAVGPGRWVQIWVAVIGLMLVEAGVWKAASRILMGRRYHALRAEVLEFIEHVRELNRSAVAIQGGAPAQGEFDAAAMAMRQAVDRMIDVAGHADDVAPASASLPGD